MTSPAPTEQADEPADREQVQALIVAALDESIDRCARCKVCDSQTNAVVRAVWPLLERDRAKLAEVKSLCLGVRTSVTHGATPIVAVERILAITGSEEPARPRITVDLNVRVRKHETYSGFDDVAGADPAGLRWGDRVLVVEVESQICSDAIVTGVDPERQLVYLAPDWHAWRDDPAKTGSDEEDTPDG